MPNNDQIFFIVGNSRSGTTMMLRILSNHPQICELNELHFFENLWSPADRHKTLTAEEAAVLISKLLYVQRDGYIGKTEAGKYLEEARAIASEMGEGPLLAHEAYAAMMRYETGRHGKSIPCEKTPQNVFYLAEILELFPRARVINMVRDPRAILLSQKRKWRRRSMGAAFITRWEVFRLRVNYHPITLSRLWNAAVRAAEPFEQDERVLQVRFEEILEAPEKTARTICEHLGVNFQPQMLEIPQASSSNEADSTEKGIDKKRAGNWKTGGLQPAEIYWCERTSGALMQTHGYALERSRGSLLMRAVYAVTFPLKLTMAILINLNRMKSIFETLKRRLR